MTHDLGPTARALLDAAREGLGPDAAALARVRANVAASTAATATGGALAMKLALVGVAAVIAAGVALREPLPRSLAAPHVELSVAHAETVLDVRVTEHSREPAAPEKPRAAHVARRAIALAPRPTQVDGVRTDGAPVAARARAADLAREVQLVDDAMAALRRHDPRGALAAVRIHARETAGRGQLAEDAAAIEIEALCQLRAGGVAAKLATFDQRWPASAQRSRLTTTCP